MLCRGRPCEGLLTIHCLLLRRLKPAAGRASSHRPAAHCRCACLNVCRCSASGCGRWTTTGKLEFALVCVLARVCCQAGAAHSVARRAGGRGAGEACGRLVGDVRGWLADCSSHRPLGLLCSQRFVPAQRYGCRPKQQPSPSSNASPLVGWHPLRRYYSLFTLVMLVTFECTVVGQRLKNLSDVRRLQAPKQV